MKNYLYYLAISFTLAISQENTNSFSLQEAIDYALENNRQQKMQQ